MNQTMKRSVGELAGRQWPTEAQSEKPESGQRKQVATPTTDAEFVQRAGGKVG